MIGARLGGDGGSVVAEFAVALPAVALVLLFGVGALSAAGRQVRLQDAAADAARIVSRGESDAAAVDLVRRAVPEAAAAVHGSGDLVCVTASAPAGIGPVRLSATSCALGGGR